MTVLGEGKKVSKDHFAEEKRRKGLLNSAHTIAQIREKRGREI